MSACESMRLALKSAETQRIPTVLSKAIKQGFTDNDLLHEYAQVVNTKLHEYTFSQLTSILKSFSIPPYKNFKFFSQLCEKIMLKVKTPDFSPNSKDISDFITSCGRLYYSDKDLIINLSKYIIPNIESYRPKDLANIYHALAKLRIHDLELFKLISNALIPYFYDLTPICLVNLFVSYARYGRTNLGEREAIYALINELNGRLSEMSAMDLLRVAMALSCLKFDSDCEFVKVEAFIDNLLKKLHDTCWPLGYVQHLVLLESLIRLKSFDSKLVYGKILPALLTKRQMVEKSLSFSENVRTIECIACLPSVNETCVKLLEFSVKSIPKLMNLDGNLIARLITALKCLNYECEDIDKKIFDIATPKFLESLDQNYYAPIRETINKVKNAEIATKDG